MKIKRNIVLIFIISIYIILQLSIVVEATTGKVSSTSIRLRKEASTSSEILETLLKGEEVEIISEEDGWYKAKYGKLTGYLSKEYIKVEEPEDVEPTTTEPTNTNEPVAPSEPASTEPIEPTTTQPISTNNNKELHILPLINSTVIYQLKTNDNEIVLQTINNWNYVEINGIRGWVTIEQSQSEPKPNTQNQPDAQDTNKDVNEPETQTSESDSQTSNNDNNQTDTKQTSTEPEPATKEKYVNVEQVNFRKDASMESTVIDTLPRNAQVEVIETKGEWSKVKHNGKEGYIATRYLSDSKVEVSTRLSEPRTSQEEIQAISNNTNSQNNNKKEELVAYAKKFLGSKYVHGGTSPSGFDCSGFTYYVYKHFGYNLSRSASAQSKNGTTISKKDLQIGDLIFFSHYKTFQGIGHVGIYIGNNQFIHASSEKTGVIITSLDSGNYPKRYVTAKRIF